jgi:hypothetical protein
MLLRKLALASVLGTVTPLLGACHGDGAARLQGKWHGVRAEGVPGEAFAAANTFSTGTQLDVKGDAITVTTPRDKQSGRYTVVRQDKTTLVIATDRDGAGDPQTFTFLDDKTLRWAAIEGKSIVFARE